MFNKKLLSITLCGISLLAFTTTTIANGTSHTYQPKVVKKVKKSNYLPVVVPLEDRSFMLGAEALYWQPTVTDGRNVYGELGDFRLAAGGSVPLNVAPHYDWGFSVMGGYHFDNTGNDIMVKYSYLRTKDTDSAETVRVNAGGAMGPSTYVLYNDAHSTLKFDYDVADLLLGQYIRVGQRLNLHLAAGARYTRLKTDLNTIYNDGLIDAAEVHKAARQDEDEYVGIGPRMMINGTFHFGGGVGLVAELGASLLMGEIDSKVIGTIWDDTDTIVAGSDQQENSIDRMVPELDAKLGLNYKYCPNHKLVGFTAEAAWQFVHYFNVARQANWPFNSTSISSGYSADVAFNGPTIGLKVIV